MKQMWSSKSLFKNQKEQLAAVKEENHGKGYLK